MFGKEHVELTKEQFEKFKGLIYRSKNLVHEKELENDQLRRQMPLRSSKNGFEASLQRVKDKTKGESIDRLKSEIRALKNENSVLRQQNDKMLGKLREFMPDKALKNFVSELKAIQPIVKIVKRVIEKGLGALSDLCREKLLDSKLGQGRLRTGGSVRTLFDRPTGQELPPQVTAVKRPWNKVSGHDIITNAEAKPSASLCERRWSECTTFSTSYLLLWQK